jgi:hypothetical protein
LLDRDWTPIFSGMATTNAHEDVDDEAGRSP